MKTETLEKLTWALIYGGLVAVGLGLSVQRTDDLLGTGVAVVGGVATAVGFTLIYVRSRIKTPTDSAKKDSAK